MFQLFLIIVGFCITLLAHTEGYASYTPGANIAMTGSNSMVRFDVRADLFGFDSIPATLDTTQVSPTFTGAFYGTGIGWIVFGTGADKVILDCGIQSISTLTTNCQLSGTGWSENIGDIVFDGVEYNPNTGLLEGTGSSNIGDIFFDNIALPLRPVIINESNLKAIHNATLSVSGAWKYDGGIIPWELSLIPIGTAHAHNTSGTNGQFSNTDISLATTYDAKITDSNGSETLFNILVEPNTLSTIYKAGYYSEDFCKNNSPYAKCPDGNTPGATILVQVPPAGSIIANATDTYDFTLKSRDAYGNRIETGTMTVKYLTTVKNIQSDIIDNIHYGPSTVGDAFISTEILTNLVGGAEKTFNVNTSDITYSIASNAPTNSTDNIIQLESITYTSGGVDSSVSGVGLFLIFDPLYGITINSGTPTIAVPNTFNVTVTKNDISSTIVPNIISTLLINDGISAEWRSLSSMPAAICAHEVGTAWSNDLCDWTDVSSIATSIDTDFTFVGTYTARIPNPPPETSHIDSYVHYTIGPYDILYKGDSMDILGANAATQRLQILGQNADTLNIGSRTRVDAINMIRAKVSVLSRNRTNYDDSDIFIIKGDYTIDASSTLFSGEPSKKPKRSVVVIGGDLTIDTNIGIEDYPLALVALSDMNNQGGNIHIKGTVTDIHSALIAEHAVVSDVSNSQLYIHGSVISANTPKELAPSTCPFFAPSGCNTSDYDLPNMRAGYIAPTNSSMSGASYLHPLIIESDPRLISDPPSILLN
ncbi:hypothetical protein K2X92_02220 [Candidatus Gracilibacteria bacterium]|nr:hypothetical protein [Candidatus Gracilibacteria bacterium]